MLGARVTDGAEGFELKKDQFRLATSFCVPPLGEDMVFASPPMLGSDSFEKFLAGVVGADGVEGLLLVASLEEEATGTSNMSLACSSWTAGLGSGETGLPSNSSQFLRLRIEADESSPLGATSVEPGGLIA